MRMGILGWLGWFIAVLELAVIVLWWKGGALDTAKADQALTNEVNQAKQVIQSIKEKFAKKSQP